MATAADIVRIARSWLHTPFVHQGRQKGLRCDCIGLIIETCREAGLMTEHGFPAGWDHVGYGRFPDSYGLTLPLLRYFTPVPRGDLQVADIALFHTSGGTPAHLGFLGDAGTPFSLIHAYSARTQRLSRVQEHRLGAQWWSRLHSAYRLPLAGGG